MKCKTTETNSVSNSFLSTIEIFVFGSFPDFSERQSILLSLGRAESYNDRILKLKTSKASFIRHHIESKTKNGNIMGHSLFF